MDELELLRRSLPNEPGVYLFSDKNHKIIYVGKALNLRKRVNQYFLKSTYNDPYYEEKIREMVKVISSIEFIVTENEKEAYILENIQIKKYQPRFNVIMRDSKTYPWIALFYSEEFPRIRIIRGPEKYLKDNILIGPYTDKKEITRILRDLRKIFPYCSCKKKVQIHQRPCLYFQLKLCPGPCIGAISQKEYRENIKKIELFLKGETTELKNQIRKKMESEAISQNYEAAAFWRDKLDAIESSTTSQNVILETEVNKDLIGYYRDENQDYIAMVIIHVREGRFVNRSSFLIDSSEKVVPKEDLFPSIVEQFYQNLNQNLPDAIVIPELYPNVGIFNEILKDSNMNIVIRAPLEEEEGLMRIAEKNARVIIEQEIQMNKIKQKEEDEIEEALIMAKDLLKLPRKPHVIEGFDISNIEGSDATGSMVYFLDGRSSRKNYRHFSIYSKSTPDDVAMMKEVISRRYSRLLKENQDLPDLILVDGGKGQLNAGHAVLKYLGIEKIPILGLAKRNEEIFVPHKKEPIILDANSPLLKLFQRVRDEAHRFAVRLHKKKREKRVVGSEIEKVKGIGPATRNKLLKEFGSVKNIRRASLDDLSQVIGKKLAERLKKEIY